MQEDFTEAVLVSRQNLATYARERARKTKTRWGGQLVQGKLGILGSL